MTRVLTRACHAVMTSNTVSGNGGVIENRGEPRLRVMANFAIGVGNNVVVIFSWRNRPVMATRTASYHLCMVDT